MLSQHSSKLQKIALIHRNKSAYSETFIRSHVEKLPAQVEEVYYENWIFPVYQQNEQLLFEIDLGSRLKRLTQRKIFKKSPAFFQTQSLVNFLKNRQIEVVLAEYGPTGVCVMEACQEANVPFVVHFHGYDAYKHRIIEEFKESYKLMLDRASAIIAVSHAMEQQLITIGASKNKIKYNPCGVDISLFTPVNVASSAPNFVSVGRFVEKKAPHLTLLAFYKAIQVCPEAKLTMIGDGNLLETCMQIAKALKIEDRVKFLGSVDHKEVMETLKTARAFLQHSIRTSQGDSEGTPVAVLEAGATGLPVIATTHAGIPDVVIHNQTGLLVEEKDIDSMAQGIITLAQDANLASKLGEAARKRIHSHFSMNQSIDNLWNILDIAIQKHQNCMNKAS